MEISLTWLYHVKTVLISCEELFIFSMEISLTWLYHVKEMLIIYF